ncbi:hypothetical protein BO94DRAFT_477683, partial [Aspergillus sclerotioniger CBS 115572]
LCLVHTTTGCGEQGFPSAQPYLSHTPGANPFCCMFLSFPFYYPFPSTFLPFTSRSIFLIFLIFFFFLVSVVWMGCVYLISYCICLVDTGRCGWVCWFMDAALHLECCLVFKQQITIFVCYRTVQPRFYLFKYLMNTDKTSHYEGESYPA